MKDVKEQFDDSFGDNVVTIAQQLRQEGIEQGIEQTKKEMALNLWLEFRDIAIVARITKLNEEEIRQLIKNAAND